MFLINGIYIGNLLNKTVVGTTLDIKTVVGTTLDIKTVVGTTRINNLFFIEYYRKAHLFGLTTSPKWLI
jgi:hypothetical protein